MAASLLLLCSYKTICHMYYFFFFFNDTATTEIYTLSLHDALPISRTGRRRQIATSFRPIGNPETRRSTRQERSQYIPDLRDRKSTRLNSSHSQISYAVFCLKKKKDLHGSTRESNTRRT